MTTATSAPTGQSDYAARVNPQWVRLLNLLEMNEEYERCSGVELHTAGGRTILDFLSGYCVHNAGITIPRIIEALQDELDRDAARRCCRVTFPIWRATLARRLCWTRRRAVEQGFLLQFGQRGRRGGHQVRPRPHPPHRLAVLRWRIPRAHLRRAVADGRLVLAGPFWAHAARSRGDSVRRCSMLWKRNSRRSVSRPSLSSRSSRKPAYAFPPPNTWERQSALPAARRAVCSG